ncbi:MAG: hypothetical protein RLZZ626_1177 [Actinomycetota bacterium]|jgi:hypothetical protein
MSENLNDPGHGDSVAAWVTVIIIMVASAVGTWAVWINDLTLLWISAAALPVALIAGLVLKSAGYGIGGSKSKH